MIFRIIDVKRIIHLSLVYKISFELSKFIREKSKIIRIPHIDFSIDVGEKNRQKIDSIMNTEN